MANQQKSIVLSNQASGNLQPTGNDNKNNGEGDIDRSTQIKLLMLLLRRDPRILLYALMFICAGFTVVPISFFIMNLSELCHTNNACDYSQLVGLLQVSMASVETILFIYIKDIIEKIGRLNTASIAFALACVKYSFYATPLWASASPYYALLSEVLQGIVFGTYLTLMVELAHFFSNEVEFLIPELVSKGIVRSDDQASCNKLKMALAATMQALMTSANDGLGRGVGALVYGILLDHYPYNTLWLLVAVGSGFVCVIIVVINILDNCFHFRLGLDQQYLKQEMQMSENIAKATAAGNNNIETKLGPQQQQSAKAIGRTLSDGLDNVSIHSRISASKLQHIS